MADPINPQGGTGTDPYGPPAPGTPAALPPPPNIQVDPNGDPSQLIDQANKMTAWLQQQQLQLQAAVNTAQADYDRLKNDELADPTQRASAAAVLAGAQKALQQNLSMQQTWNDNQQAAYRLQQTGQGKALTPEQRDLARAQAAEQNALAKKAQTDAALAADPLNQALQRDAQTAAVDAQRLQNEYQRIQNANAQAQAPYVGPNAAAGAQANQAGADLATSQAAVAKATQEYQVAVAQYGAQDARTTAAANALKLALDQQYAAAERATGLQQSGANLSATQIANQQAQFNLGQAQQYQPQLNQQAVEAGALSNQQSALNLRQAQLGDIGTFIDQTQEAIRKGVLTPEAATQAVFSKIYGETPAQRTNQAASNALNVFNTAASQGMVIAPGQQYLSPNAAPGGSYQQQFAKLGINYQPIRVDQGATSLPAFAQSLGIPTTAAQPQGNWFGPQGQTLPAFAQGMTGGAVGPSGGLLLSPQSARAMIAASAPQQARAV